MKFHGMVLNNTITLKKLYSVHYFEFSKTYSFPGEEHDFWELVYVDKGKITVTAGRRQYELGSGDLFFHKPGQWHTLQSRGGTAPNVVIFSFASDSAAMARFEDCKTTAGTTEKEWIARAVTEARHAFISPLDDPYDNRLVRAKDPPPGSEQLVGLYLTGLLLSLLRRQTAVFPLPGRRSPGTALPDSIVLYMQEHMQEKLTLAQLAGHFHISVSTLKAIFRRQEGCGVMDYFIRLKIRRAKDLLREQEYNITQIALILGYDSIYSFSAQFKKRTGMSPTEYLESVQSHDRQPPSLPPVPAKHPPDSGRENQKGRE